MSSKVGGIMTSKKHNVPALVDLISEQRMGTLTLEPCR